MSAYVVAPSMINEIISTLSVMQEQGTSHAANMAGSILNEAGFPLPSLAGSESSRHEVLGRAMYKLNKLSVAGRYPDSKELPGSIDSKGRLLPWKAAYFYPVSPVQLLKSIQCWLYQTCETKECEEHPVYLAFDKIKNYLALELVTNTPEYNAAKW